MRSRSNRGASMRIKYLFLLGVIAVSAATADDSLQAQPPLWSRKPDVQAFEAVENGRLAAAQRSIDAIVTVKGARTVDNTLTKYDEALTQINAAAYFSTLMEAVHPEPAFRERATAMTRKA